MYRGIAGRRRVPHDVVLLSHHRKVVGLEHPCDLAQLGVGPVYPHLECRVRSAQQIAHSDSTQSWRKTDSLSWISHSSMNLSSSTRAIELITLLSRRPVAVAYRKVPNQRARASKGTG